MKKIVFTSISLFLINILFSQVSDIQIIDFAKKNYMALLGSVPEKNLTEFGIKSKDDLKKIKFLNVFSEYSKQNNSITPTQNYRVIVVNNINEICGLLTIFNLNNKLSVSDFGATELAKELSVHQSKIDSKSFGIYRDYINKCDYLFDKNIPFKDASFYKLFNNSIYKYNELINSQN